MSKVRAWLQLFRVPNLLTVPGDPLAGFLIATGGRLDDRVVPAILASLFLYAAGLVLNDLADYKEDLEDRPKRPLPSGAISRFAAIVVAGNLIIFGIGSAAIAGPPVLIMGVATLLSIVFYNFFAKKIAVVGALAMGTCRLMSVLIGAAAGKTADISQLAVADVMRTMSSALALPFHALAAYTEQTRFVLALGGAVLIGIYIAAVTNLARHETKGTAPKFARLLPIGVLLLGYLALKQVTHALFLDASPTLWVMAIFMATGIAAQIMRDPMPPLPPRIGSFIRILPILQAALCVAPSIAGSIRKTPESLICAFVLLACVPLHSFLAKKFYAS